MLLSVDSTGVAHEEGRALARLHEVANAPIFFSFRCLFWQWHSWRSAHHRLGLWRDGRPASPSEFWVERRQVPSKRLRSNLERQSSTGESCSAGISAKASYPAGSEIYFRAPGAWEQYTAADQCEPGRPVASRLRSLAGWRSSTAADLLPKLKQVSRRPPRLSA